MLAIKLGVSVDDEEEYMGQIKVKSIYANALDKLDDKINHFISEENEDCLVTDVKFKVVLEPDNLNRMHYFAMILYV